MSETIDPNTSSYLPIPKLSTMQNVQVRAVNFPAWMNEALVAALRSLFDQRIECIEGLVSGLGLAFNSVGVSSYTTSGTPTLIWPELAGYPIQKTLDYWIRCVVKEYAKYKESSADGDFHTGPDLFFFEPNPTFTKAARTWSIKNASPKNSGNIVALRQVEPIVGAGTVLQVTFRGELKYDNEDDICWVEEFLGAQYGTPVDPAKAKYDPAEMLKSITRITQHFKIDEHDLDPAATLAFVQEEARRQNIDLVIGGDQADTTDGVRDEVLKALDNRSAVIHVTVGDDADPAQTVKDLIKQFGEAGVHLAVHIDPANIPADAWGAAAVLTATTALHKHTPAIKAFEGSEQQADDEEWFAATQAKMTDAEWIAFGTYDQTLVAPLGYKDGTIMIGRGGCNVSYVADYYKLMRKWFNENITDKGIPGNEAPAGWKS